MRYHITINTTTNNNNTNTNTTTTTNTTNTNTTTTTTTITLNGRNKRNSTIKYEFGPSMQQGVMRGHARLEAKIGERELRLFLPVWDPSFQSNMAVSFSIGRPNSYFMKASCVYFFLRGPQADVNIEYGDCGIGTEN